MRIPNQPLPSDTEEGWYSHLVQRALTHHQGNSLLVECLWDYAMSQGMSWGQLAASIDATPLALNKIAICRPPRCFRRAQDIKELALGLCNAQRLDELFRQIGF